MGEPSARWRKSEGAVGMRVLLTGATSMIGRATVERLRSRGDVVTVLQRSAFDEADACIQGSITDASVLVQAVAEQDAVIHLAAKVDIVGSLEDFTAVNVEATKNLIVAAQAAGVSRFVYVSSPSVAHGGDSIVGGGAGPADPTSTSGHYATTKATAEIAALASSTHAMPIVAIRPHLVIGPGDTQLIERLIDRAKAGRLPLVGSGLALVDVTWVDNAADALVAAVDAAPDHGGEAFVVSNGEPRTVEELFTRIMDAAGIDWSPRRVPAKVAIGAGTLIEKIWDRSEREDEPPMTGFAAEQLATAHWFDQQRTRDALNWEPAVSLAEAWPILAEFYQ